MSNCPSSSWHFWGLPWPPASCALPIRGCCESLCKSLECGDLVTEKAIFIANPEYWHSYGGPNVGETRATTRVCSGSHSPAFAPHKGEEIRKSVNWPMNPQFASDPFATPSIRLGSASPDRTNGRWLKIPRVLDGEENRSPCGVISAGCEGTASVAAGIRDGDQRCILWLGSAYRWRVVFGGPLKTFSTNIFQQRRGQTEERGLGRAAQTGTRAACAPRVFREGAENGTMGRACSPCRFSLGVRVE